MLIPDKRIAEVVSRLRGVPAEHIAVKSDSIHFLFESGDSLDTVELIMELEDEFDKETVPWALRYIDALAERSTSTQAPNPSKAPRPSSADPLWDRELDG
jgi:acyl carrier protein